MRCDDSTRFQNILGTISLSIVERTGYCDREETDIARGPFESSFMFMPRNVCSVLGISTAPSMGY